MAEEKCTLCSEEIEKGFMDKMIGTTIDIDTDKGRKRYPVCSRCQKEHKENIKEAIIKKAEKR